MKKFNLKKLANKFAAQLVCRRQIALDKLAENNGQFVMDHAVVFVLILVLAGIALTLLTSFLNDDLAPTLRQKILDFFN